MCSVLSLRTDKLIRLDRSSCRHCWFVRMYWTILPRSGASTCTWIWHEVWETGDISTDFKFTCVRVSILNSPVEGLEFWILNLYASSILEQQILKNPPISTKNLTTSEHFWKNAKKWPRSEWICFLCNIPTQKAPIENKHNRANLDFRPEQCLVTQRFL